MQLNEHNTVQSCTRFCVLIGDGHNMGEVMSLKEYAETRHISYESVRRQVILYDKELSKDITTQGRTRYLNQRAVDFLDSKRSIQTISVIEEAKEESAKQAIIDELEKELSEKKDLIIRLQQIIIEKDAAYIQLQEKYCALTEKQQQCAPDPVQKDDNEGQAVADPVGQERPEDVQSTTEAKEDIQSEEETQAVEEPIEEPEGVPDELKAVLDSFLSGEISAKEAWELSGLDKKTFSEMYIQYKRELNEEVTIEADEGQTAADLAENMRDDIDHERESVSDLEENKGEKLVGEVVAPDDPTKELHKMKLQKFAEEPKRTGLLRRIFSFWKN